jgi:hypothetical protein
VASRASGVSPRVWHARASSRISSAADALERFDVARVLAVFVAAEWAVILATALVVRHAGWIYYQGGDQLWYYTLGWLLGHGEVTYTLVGYGWSALLAPISWFAGPNLVSALPAIILFNVLVLMPIAMASLYGIAARIGGRLFGYWALLVWVVVPFVGIRYTNAGYHQRYTELLLPQSFGLTAMADFPSMVAALVSVYFCVRALLDDRPQLVDGLAAGIAAGASIAIKPSSAIFLVGPALALAYRRRVAVAGAMAAGLAPAIVTLAVWKERGLGNLPLLSSTHAPPRGVAAALPLAGLNLGKYTHQLDWSHFLDNLDLIREHFWSVRLIEWLVIGGLIGLARRSRLAAILVGGWFAAFVIVKGSYASASIEDGSLFRIMMPSYPAFILLLASVPLLVPHAPSRLRAWRPAFAGATPRVRLGAAAAAVLVTALAPLAAIGLASTHDTDRASAQATIMPLPVNVDLGLRADVSAGRVVLSWRAGHAAGGPVFYRVWRDRKDGFDCEPRTGATLCNVTMPEVGVTKTNGFIDRPPTGHWVYRIALAANWLDDPGYGDPYLIGRPVAVTVP